MTTDTQQSAEIASLEAQVEHWKANHAHMVERCNFLGQRHELPVDRIPAFERMTKEMAQLKALARAASAVTISAGWKLVPIEATEEMMNAAWLTSNMLIDHIPDEDEIPRHQYRAMIAAAPVPPEALGMDTQEPEQVLAAMGVAL